MPNSRGKQFDRSFSVINPISPINYNWVENYSEFHLTHSIHSIDK